MGVEGPCDLASPMADDQKVACEMCVRIFEMWGKGEMHTSLGKDEWKKAISNVWSDKMQCDPRGVKGDVFNKVYTGLDECFEWMVFFDKIGWPDLQMQIFPGAPGSNTVVMSPTAKMQYPGPDMKDGKPVEGTGGAQIGPMRQMFVWTYDPTEKKMIGFKAYWDNPQQINEAFGDKWDK